MHIRWAVAAASACLVAPLCLPAAPAVAAPTVDPVPSAFDAALRLLLDTSGDDTSTNGLTLVSAQWTRSDGLGAPNAAQTGVFSGMPEGLGMSDGLILTTGTRDAVLPHPEAPATSVKHATASTYPEPWFTLNNNDVPGGNNNISIAHDSVMLTVVAQPEGRALEVDWMLASEEFGSSEPFNDVALILVTSQFAGTPANPIDGNCAFLPGPEGPVPATTLSVDQQASYFRADPTNANSGFAGSTAPQTCRVGVEPGETVTIRFVVWDGGDDGVDTGLLLGADSLRSDPAPPPDLTVTDQTTLRKLRDNGLPATVTCYTACSPKVRVTIPAKLAKTLGIDGTRVGDNVVIGTKQVELAGIGDKTVKVSFADKTLNKLGRAKPDKITMKASLVGVAGTTEPVVVRIR